MSMLIVSVIVDGTMAKRKNIKGNRKYHVFVLVCTMTLLSAGCSRGVSEQTDDTPIIFEETESIDAETVAAILSDISAEAIKENTLGSLDTTRRMIARLDEHGYTAADMENQIDMAGRSGYWLFAKPSRKKKQTAWQ